MSEEHYLTYGITCYPIQVNSSFQPEKLAPQRKVLTYLLTSKVKLTWAIAYIVRCFMCLQIVTHLWSNQAWHKATTLMLKFKVLTTTPLHHHNRAYLNKACWQYEPTQQPESFLQFPECQIHRELELHRSYTAAAKPHDISQGWCPSSLAPNHLLQCTVNSKSQHNRKHSYSSAAFHTCANANIKQNTFCLNINK